jgi:hypothetical protein
MESAPDYAINGYLQDGKGNTVYTLRQPPCQCCPEESCPCLECGVCDCEGDCCSAKRFSRTYYLYGPPTEMGELQKFDEMHGSCSDFC